MTKHEVIEAYITGRIDRRDFVRRLTALGVSGGAALAYAESLTPAAAAGTTRDANGFIVRAQAAGTYGPGGDFGDIIEFLRSLIGFLENILSFLDNLFAKLNIKARLQTGDLSTSDLDQLATLRTQLTQHRDALRTAIGDFGGTPPSPPSTVTTPDVTEDALSQLADLLNGLVGVYSAVIPTITGSGPKTSALHQTLTQIALVEARQAAFVNRLLGEPAFPETFEPAATKDDIDQLLAGLAS
jgi:hypothetical protein